MGLDAFVYCDCYERGRLIEPPPTGTSPKVQADGSLNNANGVDTLEADLLWDNWREHRACEHRGGIFFHHRLGNMALIGLLRAELQREAATFPILLNRAVYSGSHCGDFIAVENISSLREELARLKHFQCTAPEATQFMGEFCERMTELANVALSIAKPIAFN